MGSKRELTYNDLISSDRFEVNKPLLKSLKDANPGLSDKELIKEYNGMLDQVQAHSKLNYYPFKTTKSQQEEVNRIIPLLMGGNAKVKVLDANKNVIELSPEQVKDLGLELSNPDNRLKGRYAAVGKALGNTGHVASGSSIVSTGDKTYFIENPNTNITNANRPGGIIERAFGYMKDGRTQGDYFEVLDSQTGQPYGLVGRTDYINGVPHRTFYPAKQTADGKTQVKLDDPVTINGRLAEPFDIERLLMEKEILNSFPRVSKSNVELEQD